MLGTSTLKSFIAVFCFSLCAFAFNTANAQVFFSEDFEGVTAPALPAGWTTTNSVVNTPDPNNPGNSDVFYTGTDVEANAGGFFNVAPHTTFAMANDDYCGQPCDMTDVRLILPPQDFSGQAMVSMTYDAWVDATYADGLQVEVSLDMGTTWTPVGTAPTPTDAWQDGLTLDLSAYDGMADVWIAFMYTDGGQWGSGVAVDNVSLSSTPPPMPTCFFNEDFEGVTTPALPAGWTTTNPIMNTPDPNNPGNSDLFYTGTDVDANAGGFFNVAPHTQFAMANDDYCGQPCDMTDVRLILPPQDLSSWGSTELQAEVWVDATYADGLQVEVSLDMGTTWIPVGTAPTPMDAWQVITVDLSAYDGMADVWIAFMYNDGGQWGSGVAVDDVCVAGFPTGPNCFFVEDFEGVTIPALPAGWTTTNPVMNTPDPNNPGNSDLFYTGTDVEANAGGFFNVGPHTQFAMANDDYCGQPCDMTDVRLILPPQDFSGFTNIEMSYEMWLDETYSDMAQVEVSTDMGTTWNIVGLPVTPMDAWQVLTANLSAYAGMSDVWIAFMYNDGGEWGSGVAVDDISICEMPGGSMSNGAITAAPRLNAEYTLVPIAHETPVQISAEVFNLGGTDLTNLILTSNLFEESDPVNPIVSLTTMPMTLGAGMSVTLDNNPGLLPIGGVGRWYVEHIITHDDSANESDTQNDTLVTPIFEISELTYARNDTNTADLGAFGIGDMDSDDNAIIGQTFELMVDDVVESVEVVIAADLTGNAPVGQPISVALYACDANGVPQGTAIDTTEVQLGTTPGMNETHVLAFDTPVPLTAGIYFFGALEPNLNVRIRGNDDIYTPGNSSAGTNWVNFDDVQTWTEPTELVSAFAVAYHIRPIFEMAACDPGDIVSASNPIGVCGPNEMVDLSTGGSSEIPPAGGFGWSFSPGADGTGGVVTGFSINNSSPDIMWDPGLNGILAANGLQPLVGTWEIQGYAYADAADIQNSLCGFTPTTLTVIFTAGDLALAPTSTDEDCGQANGSADAGATGGYMGLSYEWSNGSTDNPATGLTAGVYDVTVTDDAGCSLETSVTIASADGPNPTLDSTTDVDCFGTANGQINISVSGGVMPYTFNWSNGSMMEDPDGLSGGSYDGTVTDANGCSFVVSGIVINEPAGPVAPDFQTLVINNVSCNGLSDGSVSVDIVGGTPPYTYLWSNNATTASLDGLAAGAYTGTVTDMNGCEFVTPIPLTITEPDPITAMADITDESAGGAMDGGIVFTPEGGTEPYTFEWSNGETTQDISGIGAGNYMVTVTDDNGCEETFSYDLIIVGIEDIEELQSLTVYPNPSADNVFIDVELDQVMDIKLDIYTVTGQLVTSFPVENVSNKQYQLSMRDQPAGIYMARLIIGDQAVTERFTIAR
ncbi:MAG: choice-of-anchor J domain-containing protein [Bacteroidota bacterium]